MSLPWEVGSGDGESQEENGTWVCNGVLFLTVCLLLGKTLSSLCTYN